MKSKKPSGNSKLFVNGIVEKLNPERETEPNLEVPDNIAICEVSTGRLVLVKNVDDPFYAI